MMSQGLLCLSFIYVAKPATSDLFPAVSLHQLKRLDVLSSVRSAVVLYHLTVALNKNWGAMITDPCCTFSAFVLAVPFVWL